MAARISEGAADAVLVATQVEERQRQLEAVGRVLAPALQPETASGLDRNLAALSRSMASVRSHRQTLEVGIGDPEAAAAESAALSGEVRRVETALEAHAVAVRSALDDVPLAALRGRLSDAEGLRREEVLALLDLVLEDEAELARHGDLLDYLVTLLSTEERGSRRRIAHDPATLTPRLTALGERVGARLGEDPAGLEREFLEAARRCETGGIAAVVPEMRARKAGLGAGILAPGVLRAIVFYNATVWSALRLRLEAERGVPTTPPTSPAAGKTTAPRPAPIPPPVAPDGGARPARAADPAWAEEPAGPGPATGRDPSSGGDVRWNLETPSLPAAPAAGAALRWAPRRRVVAALSGAGLAALAAVALLPGRPPDSAQTLSSSELGALSPWLRDGYRDHARKGSLFIGSVTPGWRRLPADQRQQNVAQLVAELSRTGIREVLLYDDTQRLVVHHAAGLPLRILL